MQYEGDFLVIYLLNNAICMVCISLIFRMNAKKSISWIWKFLSFLVFFFVMSGAFLILHNPTFSFLLNTVFIFGISFLYINDLKKNLLMVLWIYFIMILSEALAMTALGISPQEAEALSNDRLKYVYVVESLIMSVFVMVFRKYTGMKSHNDIPWRIWLIIMGFQGTLIFMTVYMAGKISAIDATVFYTSIIVANFGLIYLVERLLQMEDQKKYYALIDEQNRSYANEIEILMDSQKKVRKMNHDLKNHFFAIRIYLEQKRLDELKSYLDRMEQESQSNVNAVYTGHPMVDAIINYKESIARKHGIKFEIEKKIPEMLKIDDFDISVLMGNILDNAIEACDRAGEKAIRLSLVLIKNQFFITVRNTYDGSISWKNGIPVTKKLDRTKHGIGLANVKSVVDKYSGTLKLYEENGFFVVKIMFFIS